MRRVLSHVCKLKHCRVEGCPAQGYTANRRGERIYPSLESLMLMMYHGGAWTPSCDWYAQPDTRCLRKYNSSPLISWFRSHMLSRGLELMVICETSRKGGREKDGETQQAWARVRKRCVQTPKSHLETGRIKGCLFPVLGLHDLMRVALWPLPPPLLR